MDKPTHNWAGYEHVAKENPRPLPEGYVLDGLSALPGESKEAYEAYRFYLELGPGRTFAQVAVHCGTSNPAVVDRAFRERWKQRAALFDRFMVEEEQAAIRAQMEKKAAVMVERRMKLQDEEWEDHLKIQKKTDLMLTWPTFIQEVQRDGKTIKYIPYKWSATSLAQLLEQKSILARRSAELPTTYTQMDINAGTSQEISTAHMTPEEKARHENAQRIAAEAYLAAMQAEEIPALTARVTPMPEPPAWYAATGETKEAADVPDAEHSEPNRE
jgi:hypothetical protein